MPQLMLILFSLLFLFMICTIFYHLGKSVERKRLKKLLPSEDILDKVITYLARDSTMEKDEEEVLILKEILYEKN